jgi:hypothetical protein
VPGYPANEGQADQTALGLGSLPRSCFPQSFAGVSQLVESLLPKQDVVGSIPIARSLNVCFQVRFSGFSRETHLFHKALVLAVYIGVVQHRMA